MRVANKLVLIVAGYGLAVGGGIAAVAVNERLIPEDVQQSSGGMVAFGDMIVFVLASGFLSVAPTWLLLKLCVEKIPRALIAAELLFGMGFAVLFGIGLIFYLVGTLGERGLDWAETGVRVVATSARRGYASLEEITRKTIRDPRSESAQ